MIIDLGSAPEVPLASVSKELRTAREALYAAQEGVLVAQARLREAEDAEPQVSPRVAAAVERVETARADAQKAAQVVMDLRRALADAEGDLEAAHAAVEDLESGEKEYLPGQAVAARVRVEKRTRAVDAAATRLLDAQEAQGTAETALAAAEERHAAVLRLPATESAALIKARVGVEAALRRVEAAQEDLDEAERAEALAQAAAAEDEGSADGDADEGPLFASLDAFVEGYVLPQWRHKLGGSVSWCGHWWRHSEAISRLEAVWEAWEAMRREPAPAMSTWWRDHLDPHMRALTDAEGTFCRCSADVHDPIHDQAPVWMAHQAPDGLFATNPDAPQQPTRILSARAVETAAATAGHAATGTDGHPVRQISTTGPTSTSSTVTREA